jgi:D-alanyl-D-alanine carboxypeptidase
MSTKRIKKSRVILALAITVGSIFALDSLRRDFFITKDTTVVVSGNFKNSGSSDQSLSDDTSMMNNNNTQQTSSSLSYIGYSEFAVPSLQLSSGLLTVVNQEHPAATSDTGTMVKLSEEKNEFYTLRSDDLLLNEDAADALNQMMEDYNNATGLSDIIIYSTTQPYTGSDSLCPDEFPESSGGFTVDLAVQGAYDVLEYDGADEEAWIIENCTNYGFILRYPTSKSDSTGQSGNTWHLRYVGKVHAAIMNQNNLSLEEYNNWLKSYTLETEPLSYTLDDINYEIYYTASMGDTTSVRVPVSGNYTISGNNIDGFVVTAIK